MKKIILLTTIFSFLSSTAFAEYVNGYYKKDGTYVQGYERTNPNSNKLDNYSTKGNTNPHTGKKGYADPYSE